MKKSGDELAAVRLPATNGQKMRIQESGEDATDYVTLGSHTLDADARGSTMIKRKPASFIVKTNMRSHRSLNRSDRSPGKGQPGLKVIAGLLQRGTLSKDLSSEDWDNENTTVSLE